MVVKVLRGIEGPLTRESVTRALRDVAPVNNALAAGPFVFGPAVRRNPNRRSLAGRWRVVHPPWLDFPAI